MVHHLEEDSVMEREKQWDRVFLQDEKYSSMFAQWKSSAGREDLTCWRKGDSWNDALEEARGTGTGTAVVAAWTVHLWRWAGGESVQVCGRAGGICGSSLPTAPTVPVKEELRP